MKRLIEFDIAKAICIILVVIGHYVPDDSPDWWKMIRDVIYTFHMPLFMFASGYIYMAFRKIESYKMFIWNKVQRLMIPYVVTSIIVVTVKLLTQNNMYVQNPVTPMSYLRLLYLPEAGYFLWFCWALFLIFCIVHLLHTRNARLSVFIVSIVWHYWHPFELTEVFCITQATSMLMFFMFGVFCHDFKDTVNYLKRIPAFAIYILFLGLEFLFVMQNEGGGMVI